MALRKKKNKEVSNNNLSKQIDGLLTHIKAIDERIDANGRKLSDQIEAVNTSLSIQVGNMSEQVEVVALAVANVQNRLAEINHKIIGTNQKINGLDNRFDDFALNRAKVDEVNARFLRLEKKVGLSKN